MKSLRLIREVAQDQFHVLLTGLGAQRSQLVLFWPQTLYLAHCEEETCLLSTVLG